MKVFVLGCNGMAGHMISLYFLEKGHEVVGFARTSSGLVPTIEGDAFDTPLLSKTLSQNKFDAVINCIGILNKFAEDRKDHAVFLNAYLPHFLAAATKELDTKVVHMSTDCVFSGQNGPYTADAFRDGETFYDRSKGLGELEDTKNLTLRNSIVGPDMNPRGIGLLNWFLQQKGPVTGYTGSLWTGQTTLQLAKTMETALNKGMTGLVNAVPRSSISKYELLRLFNQYMRAGKVGIEPVVGIQQDKTLLRSPGDFDFEIPDYDTMVQELANWMREHGSLYAHYGEIGD